MALILLRGEICINIKKEHNYPRLKSNKEAKNSKEETLSAADLSYSLTAQV